jgi:hypothetical protein
MTWILDVEQELIAKSREDELEAHELQERKRIKTETLERKARLSTSKPQNRKSRK